MGEESTSNDFAHEQGLTKEQVAERYCKWAQNSKYERDLREENYKGPVIAANAVADLFPNAAQKSSINILDAAAGSGFAAEKLKEKGFSMMDALEPSKGMLTLAKEKDLYQRTFQAFLDGKQLPIESDYYDVVLICGGMGEGHIPCAGMEECIRMTKPGGYVVIVMREQYLSSVAEYKDRLEPHMKELTQKGKWEPVSRTVVPRYSFNNNGVVFVFKVKGSS
ncbi:uncharacterized protein LOC101863490 [Aplysia californica]|uniref:Uncharacterized protein LOC101863490 n=1 Tax=Aplysia californica TaxID=6500 RepID=A0ABM0JEQ4_APLCA|nr:uncharacterized protein LOC101863490 [Aplysia californica]